MDKPVTVGVDGSPSSMRALDWAADEAALHNLPLRIVHASLWERFEGTTPAAISPSQSKSPHWKIIIDAEARARQRRPEVRVHAEALPGEPVDALVHAGEYAFALVVGHRGHHALVRRLVHRFRRSRCRRTRGGHRGRWRLCPSTSIRKPAGRPRCRGRNRRRRRPCRLRPPRGTCSRWRPVSRFTPSAGRRRGTTTWPWLTGSGDALRARQSQPGRPSKAASSCRRTSSTAPHTDALLQAAQHADLLVLGVQHRHGMVHRELRPTHHAALRHSPCPVALASLGQARSLMVRVNVGPDRAGRLSAAAGLSTGSRADQIGEGHPYSGQEPASRPLCQMTYSAKNRRP
ncbi:hypothetical protein SALBM217S_05212 [Streptomyces griseoloalbus]